MTTTEQHVAALRVSARKAEALEWGASVQNDARNSAAGSSDTGKPDSPPSSTDSLPHALTRLASAMEEQNEALWALIHQTAALIAVVAEQVQDDDDGDDPPRYLDGSRVS